MTQNELHDLLPERDVEFLLDKGWPDRIDVSRVGPEIHVRVRQHPLPDGRYDQAATDVLVRLVPPYPNENPDMFWTLPQLKLTNGTLPSATEIMQVPAPSGFEQAYQGVSWQRWSRHYNDKGVWRPGIDGLRTYFASICQEFEKQR
jgi:hypothetical protein